MVSGARGDEYRVHRGRHSSESLRTRGESRPHNTHRECNHMAYLYYLPNGSIDMACGGWVFLLHVFLSSYRVSRTNCDAEGCSSRTSVTSIRIRAIHGEHRKSFYSFSHRTTHAVRRDTMARIDEWSRDIRWMVGHDSRPCDGTRIRRGWTHRTHRDTHSIHDTELQKSLPFISGRVVTSCWIPRLSHR